MTVGSPSRHARGGSVGAVIAPQRRLSFVSTVSSHGPGGLCAYVRHLRAALPKEWQVSETVRFAAKGPSGVDYSAREDASSTASEPGDGIQIAEPAGVARLGLSRVHHLVNRPPLARLGVATFSAAYRPGLSSTIPGDVEVVHYVGAGWELLGFPALTEARRRGAGFAVTPAIHPGVWGDSTLDARLHRAADAVFAFSEFERTQLIGLGVAPGRAHVTPLAPALETVGDAERFRRDHGLGERPIVLFVGRRERYKGYHGLRAAMDGLVRAVPGTCLVSVGHDAEPPYPPIPDDAHVDLGVCDEQQKADALAACDVFCMPSDGESLGIAYLEAWAHGKPVVAGRAPAVAELVTDGENGFCTSRDPESIGSVLTQLLSDRALRERLGSAGQELQRTRYTWTVAAEIHDSVFRSIGSASR
jgi:phosphatidyl-myo-inositol dimannoside synthase